MLDVGTSDKDDEKVGGEVKALSLLQPWATLVATNEKRIETRSWPTNYRGEIYIHASKGFSRWQKELCQQAPFKSALLRHKFMTPGCRVLGLSELPLGMIIASCKIADCVKITGDFRDSLSENEFDFGDYTLGRFAWILKDIWMLAEPVPAKGNLGIWNWERSDQNASS